jgi:hypothetical protein
MNRRALILVALLLAACAETTSRWVNGMTAPHIGSSIKAEPPSRERMTSLPDYQDCNHDALDGRETDVKSSDAHCGACGHACDGGHCERGVCK